MMLKRTGALWGRLSRIKGLIHGLITQIEDPNGNLYNNTNDGAGDLKTYRDPTMTGSQGVTYSYNSTHGMTRITDPRGITPIKNEYDPASGRLIRHTDANDNTIEYTHDLANNREVLTNRLSIPATYIYDSRGNATTIIQVVNGLPATTLNTYDQYDNKLSELLPGNSSSSVFTYADTNNPRLMTRKVDPEGNVSEFSYDLHGNMTRQATGVGTAGQQTTFYTYNPTTGNQESIQDAAGNYTTFTYDQVTGLLTGELDQEGCYTQYLNDVSGAVTTEIRAVGRPEQQVVRYTYDANGNRKTEVRNSSAGMLTTTFTYDAANRLTRTDLPDGNNTQTGYDSLGKAAYTQNQKGRQVGYFYDALGRPSTIFYPDNTKAIYGYDAEGRRTDATDRGGRTTHTDYDELGRPTTVTFQGGSRRITQYDAQGRVTDTIDENGNRTHFTYDDAGRRLTATSGYLTSSAQETAFTYDANGNVLTVTVNGRPQVTLNTYDAMNRLTRVDYPDSTFTRTEYDNVGRKTASVDQAGKRTEFSWDGLSRLTEVRQITSGGILRTAYTYDKVGNMLTQTDANNHTTTYTANVMNRRTSRTLPDGRTESCTSYDELGNLTGKTDFAGHQFTYGYDLNDHLTSVTGPVNLGYTYDSAMFRVGMDDSTGHTTFHHDSRNRMTEQISPSGWGTLTFTNYPTGHVDTVQSSNSNGNDLTYQLDALNRPATILDGSKTTVINYDASGNLNSIILPNGVTVIRGHDSLNRLTGVTVVNNIPATVGRYTYTLGAGGNREKVQEANGRAVSWLPDDLYRLTEENILVDPAGNTGTVDYSYDNVGNRNTRTSTVAAISSQNFTGGYDLADQLKPTYSFDLNGNQLNDARGFTYTYNALNQLTRVQGTGVDVSYVYDGDGLRVQRTNHLTSVTTNYLWDRNNLTGYPQVSEELVNGQVVRRYVYGPTGPLYMVQLVGGNWVTSYYGRDAQSVRFLMDDSGNVTDSYTWDVYGNTLSKSGAGTSNPMGFHSETGDEDTGLTYLRARWYNPDLGRFIQMDGFEGAQDDPRSRNYYVGFLNDPVNRLDPTGDYSIGEASFQVASAFVRAAGNKVYVGAKTAAPVQQRIKVEKFLKAQGGGYDKYFFSEQYHATPWGAVNVPVAGLQIDLVASTKGRYPEFPKYRWVQQVTTNYPVPNLVTHTLVGPGTFYDPPGTSLFYYDQPGQEDEYRNYARGYGYDHWFTDKPSVELPQGNGQYTFDATLYFVGVQSDNDYNPVPIFEINYGFKLTRVNNGLTLNPLTTDFIYY